MMFDSTTLRPATRDQVPQLVEHFIVATEGVCLCSWSRMFPNRPPRESGLERMASDESVFSYRNCEVMESEGEVVAMMMAFPMPESAPDQEEAEPDPQDPLAPYSLELPGSYYLCALSVSPAYRGRGLGKQLITRAEEKGRALGHDRLSLLVFEENAEAIRLYERLGFLEIDRRPIVPHPLIAVRGGDVILMAKTV